MKSSMAMTAYLCQRACSVFSVCSMRWFGLRRLLLLSLHPLAISDIPVPQTPRLEISPDLTSPTPLLPSPFLPTLVLVISFLTSLYTQVVITHQFFNFSYLLCLPILPSILP